MAQPANQRGKGLAVAIAILALWFSAEAMANQAGELVTLTQATAEVTLKTLDTTASAVFSHDRQQLRVPVSEIVRWGNPRRAVHGPLLCTAGGSQLVGVDTSLEPDVVVIKDDTVYLITNLFDTVRIPLEKTTGLIFRLPTDTLKRDLLVEKLNDHSMKSDEVLLANGDRLQGTILQLNEDMLSLKTAVGDVNISIVKITALFFGKTRATPMPVAPAKLHRIGFPDGTLLLAQQAQLGPDHFYARLPSGIKTESPQGVRPCYFQPSSHRTTYLSDLKPLAYKHVPYLSLAWPYHTDRNVRNTMLSDSRHLYLKGVGMHSAARLTYKLDKAYRQLQTKIALDKLSGNGGSVVFRIYVNDGSGWKDAYTSPIVRGGDEARAVRLPLQNVKAVTLMVDFAEQGDTLDYANWLDIRLIQ